ncbi:hypothetical protein Syun_012692 [Stephania yunnanensis]|uniref:Ycf20-like protein n=1 Tax=Stephania yunnanensis TaxID=152371 RepID=A0AAP0JZY8_9MAGN
MAMATKISSFPIYPSKAVVLSYRRIGSRLASAACPCKSAFAFKNRKHPQHCLFDVPLPSVINTSKCQVVPRKNHAVTDLNLCQPSSLFNWRIVMPVKSSADGGMGSRPEAGPDGGTRLVRAIQDVLIKLNSRFKELRKGFPMKVLFFLAGFYCATAFATVIGQTGDWDILSAGLAVFVVEGIGAIMYRASFSVFDKFRSLITMFNYWKAGLSLGLFLDAFKYEMDDIFGLGNPFNFEIDIFPTFF